MRDVVVVGMARTPIGKFLGSLSSLTALQLGAYALTGALKRAGLKPKELQGYIMGNVLSAGLGQNPAREAALLAGIPAEIGGFTVNRVCGSSLQAIILAMKDIMSGEKEIMLAGGMESMSRAPHLLYNGREIKKYGDIEKEELMAYPGPLHLVDSMIYDGLWCSFNKCHMGTLAENVRKRYDVSRKLQDELALRSHQRALLALEGGYFKEEIVPVRVNGRVVQQDDGPRRDTTLERLSQLKPVFGGSGTVTAGNASQLSDGAAALVLMSRQAAKKHGLPVLATLGAYAEASTDPAWYTLAPIQAVRTLLKKTGRTLREYDLIEANEAFAAQYLAVEQGLKLDRNKVNVYGGAIALGHPIGATGARFTITLINALRREKKKRGLATLCIGGGEALALEIRV